jgi:hypothetical protein
VYLFVIVPETLVFHKIQQEIFLFYQIKNFENQSIYHS